MTTPDPVTDPASVLSPELLAAARAAGRAAPPFTPAQRDLLTAVFRPAVTTLTDREKTPA